LINKETQQNCGLLPLWLINVYKHVLRNNAVE